jgi:hypothetical protein
MRPDELVGNPVAIDVRALARVARGLEAGGIYNGAKLVRALVDRELARTGFARPLAGAELAAAVAAIADELAVAGDDATLVASLRAAAAAAAAEAPLTLAEAPRTWTCRICGRISVGAVPAWCPTCEAPAAQAREQVPVWYLDPIIPAEALAQLEAGLATLQGIVAACPRKDLDRAPRPGEWSVRETLQHLVAAEELLFTRIPRLLEEDDPELVATAAWVLPPSDEAAGSSDLSAPELLDRLRSMRGTTVARLRTIPDEAWRRPGRHPEWGAVTVTSQAGYFARHLWSHLAQVRAAAAGRVPGEPTAG